MTTYTWTRTQGQYLAFIYNYTVIHGQPPSEGDMQQFFRVSPPSVHQMVLRLEDLGFISRVPRQARTIRVLVPPDQLPLLEPVGRPSPAGTGWRASIYRIKVTLDESRPPIWRRILLPDDVTLEHLHYIVQVAMGWTNSHLHMFTIEGVRYGEPHPDGVEMRDERRVRLGQVVAEEGSRFGYEYDFGDTWLHTLLVEGIGEPEPGQRYPVCVGGERACPPEDVGGVWGYDEFLEAVTDPGHPEHQDLLDWAGGEFDPDRFDLEEVNQMLWGLG